MSSFDLAAVIFLLAISLSSVPARAQQPDLSENERNACIGDYRKLCPGIRPGEGRVIACFQDHIRQVSPGCRDALKDKLGEKKTP